MRISDWSSDVCSSDLQRGHSIPRRGERLDDRPPELAQGIAAKSCKDGMSRLRPALVFHAVGSAQHRRTRMGELPSRPVIIDTNPRTDLCDPEPFPDFNMTLSKYSSIVGPCAGIRIADRSEERRVGKEWGST